ncbi:chemotaxis signal transduction protein [Rubidibacter lacunae KORDI 51-2]|uniref:Chemotaxis signal transduction protein n=1 Tax=Rubidibacter lacunae KORDI 51-2 TaxID=582515 RepID=U5DH82_9CHRO|nr:chemotaxis protein CheW [Rubidibacter lacunae]ERN40961.1 chemotaxis signal transduction protein [Rubidibacter lacunae KORDI 51-2]
MTADQPLLGNLVPSNAAVEDFEQRLAPEGELYLRFCIPSGKEFALSATGIREVVSQSPGLITAIPNASYLLLGTMNLRGQVIWVADLGQFLGETTALTTERSEIPVIAIEEQETTIGLAVEDIIGMDWLDTNRLRMSSSVPDSMTSFVSGEWDLDAQSGPCLRLLDAAAILRSARWAA